MRTTTMRRRAGAATVAAVACLPAASCGGSSGTSGHPGGTTGDLLVVVSAPVSTSPWIATFEERGARLAAAQLAKHGGPTYGGRTHKFRVEVRDDAGSPQTAAAIARTAVSEHAVALVTDGVGAAAVADVTKPASLPVFVVFEGGASVVDPQQRPTLFRLAPADKPMAVRLADYLAGRHPRIGLLADDTSYGRDGAGAMRAAFTRDTVPVVSDATVPAAAGDVSSQVLAARRAGATTLVVWAGAPVVAAAVQAARPAGWSAPIWAGPRGEDPLVRQRLAAHRDWLTGVGFVSFRITSEQGPAPFNAYRTRYDSTYREEPIGVKEGGKAVVSPPDWSMYSYDALALTAAALTKAGGPGAPLLQALQGSVVVTGANGDERGFSDTNHEGVSPDDMYFAQFHGFVFEPVTDDPLSTGLPTVRQTA